MELPPRLLPPLLAVELVVDPSLASRPSGSSSGPPRPPRPTSPPARSAGNISRCDDSQTNPVGWPGPCVSSICSAPLEYSLLPSITIAPVKIFLPRASCLV